MIYCLRVSSRVLRRVLDCGSGLADHGQLYLFVEIDMKMNRFKSILISFASLSVLFIALPGFADNGAIKVKCVDSSSNPVQAVNVVVSPVGSQKNKEKKSDAKGEVEFTKLDDGLYRVVGRKDGFEPALF